MTMTTTMPGMDPTARKPDYDGKLGELYGIFFKNLLLNIITLGWYRFWARTNYRRYLWSRVSLDGDRFEYTGTGLELLKGFMIAFVIIFFSFLLPYILLLVKVAEIKEGETGSLAAASTVGIYGIWLLLGTIVLLCLLVISRFTARRYRLNRTTWRGIRGGMGGSAGEYLLRSIGYGILTGLTLGLFRPAADIAMAKYQINNMYYGTAKANSTAETGKVFWWYFLSWISVPVVLIVVFALGGLMFAGEIETYEHYKFVIDAPELTPEQIFEGEPELQAAVLRMLFGFIALYLVAVLTIAGAQMLYFVQLLRHVASTTSLAGLSSTNSYSFGGILWLAISNFFILVFTLGFGLPIVLHRIWTYFARNTFIAGKLDDIAVKQGAMSGSSVSEGFLDLGDPGLI